MIYKDIQDKFNEFYLKGKKEPSLIDIVNIGNTINSLTIKVNNKDVKDIEISKQQGIINFIVED